MDTESVKWNVLDIETEQCAPDKEVTDTICQYDMLHLILSGKGTFNGCQLHAGQAFLCRTDRKVTYFPDPADPWCYAYCNLRGAAARQMLEETGFSGTDVIGFEVTQELRELLSVASGRHDARFLRGMFLALTALISPTEKNGADSRPRRLYRRAAELIEVKNGAVTPASLADALGISRSYLRNLFSEYGGVSVQNYIMRYRADRAAELLETTDYPVADIAGAVGYADPFQFTRMFTRRKGISPTAYRRRCRGTANRDC